MTNVYRDFSITQIAKIVTVPKLDLIQKFAMSIPVNVLVLITMVEGNVQVVRLGTTLTRIVIRAVVELMALKELLAMIKASATAKRTFRD